jgi:hypothetical protein
MTNVDLHNGWEHNALEFGAFSADVSEKVEPRGNLASVVEGERPLDGPQIRRPSCDRHISS